MAAFELHWTPVNDGNSTGQEVQYKAASSLTWLTADTVSASTSSYTIDTLYENTIYDFRIVNVCTYGGPAAGSIFQTAGLTCPTLMITPTHNGVSFSFYHLGGDVNEYRVDLLDASGSGVIAFKNILPLFNPMVDSFTGLSASTTYRLRVTVRAEAHSNVCNDVGFATTAVPTCSAPTGLVGVIGDEESES